MGYSKTITPRVELVYGRYFDLIADLPAEKEIVFNFHSIKQCSDARNKIYNWIKTNGYEGYYRVEWEKPDEKLSLKVTNNTPAGSRLPTPIEVKDYLINLPTESIFEIAKGVIEHFNLIPTSALAEITWIEEESSSESAPTIQEIKQESAYDDVW